MNLRHVMKHGDSYTVVEESQRGADRWVSDTVVDRGRWVDTVAVVGQDTRVRLAEE